MISRTLWSKYANLNPWTMKEGDKLQSEKESLDKERRQISGLKKEAEEPHQVQNLLSQFSVCSVFSTCLVWLLTNNCHC